MTNRVRLYDGTTITPALDFNAYHGRWTCTVDPFTWPTGTDGTFFEYDFAVADPLDSTLFYWFYIGCNTALPTSTVTGGFTFDSDAPPAWADYWGVGHKAKTAYDGTYPSPIIYDGTYTAYNVSTPAFSVDVASHPDWYQHAPVPPWDPPDITMPASGITINSAVTDILMVSWNYPSTGGGLKDADIRVVLDADDTIVWHTEARGGVSLAHELATPYSALTGPATLQVRHQPWNTYGWSDWASIPITLAPTIVENADCFRQQIIGSAPVVAYLFQDTEPPVVEDISGHGFDGQWQVDYRPVFMNTPAAWQNSLGGSSNNKFGPANYGMAGQVYPVAFYKFYYTPGDPGNLDVGDTMSYMATMPADYSIATPAGWTAHVDNVVSGGVRAYFATKVHEASDPDTYPFTMTGPGDPFGVGVSLTGVFQDVTLADVDMIVQGDDDHWHWPGFTAGSCTDFMFCIGFAEPTVGSVNGPPYFASGFVSYGAGGYLVFGGFTPRVVGTYSDYTMPAEAPGYHGYRVAVIVKFETTDTFTPAPITITVPNPAATYAGREAWMLLEAEADSGYRYHPTYLLPPRSPSTPAGWTLIGDVVFEDTRWLALRRVIQAGDPDTVDVTWPDRYATQKWAVAFSQEQAGLPFESNDHALVVGDAQVGYSTPSFDEPGSVTYMRFLRRHAKGDTIPFGHITNAGTGEGVGGAITSGANAASFKGNLPGQSTVLSVANVHDPVFDTDSGIEGIIVVATHHDWDDYPILNQHPAPVCDAGCDENLGYLAGLWRGDDSSLDTADRVYPSLQYIANADAHGDGTSVAMELVFRFPRSLGANDIDRGVWLSAGGTLSASISSYFTGYYTWITMDDGSTIIFSEEFPFELGCWYHLVASFYAGKFHVFINGLEVRSQSTSRTPHADYSGAMMTADADVLLAAYYRDELDSEAIRAHFRHLCDLCGNTWTKRQVLRGRLAVTGVTGTVVKIKPH
jgi:hypothetical protein